MLHTERFHVQGVELKNRLCLYYTKWYYIQLAKISSELQHKCRFLIVALKKVYRAVMKSHYLS